ncbi:hypothetical protein N7478_004742 [Penicillium angulare]|uniref:uncharacterized protein n=1 Tax=Penicillium angulare TaxID=116970 RepID=UPI002541A3F3|nr:uncharacterized protein N7478_004742 [Penicillium angulare]KAJ5279370.1 hypothetical protein N7478_004742 [Penicillium angulare]
MSSCFPYVEPVFQNLEHYYQWRRTGDYFYELDPKEPEPDVKETRHELTQSEVELRKSRPGIPIKIPLEIARMIRKFIPDLEIQDLLNLRLLSSSFCVAATEILHEQIFFLDRSREKQNELWGAINGEDEEAERKIRALVVEYPNIPGGWEKSTALEMNNINSMYQLMREHVIYLTCLKRLTIHIRPPKGLGRGRCTWEQHEKHIDLVLEEVFHFLKALPNLESLTFKTLPSFASLPGDDIVAEEPERAIIWPADPEPPADYDPERDCLPKSVAHLPRTRVKCPLIAGVDSDEAFARWRAGDYIHDRYSKRELKRHGLKKLKLELVGSGVWPIKYEETPVVPRFEYPPPYIPSIGSEVLESPTHWIVPLQDTLRELSIHCYGLYMYDMTYKPGPSRHEKGLNLPFLPNLKSLELRGNIFTCDESFNWILLHAKTLGSIKLDDCAILYSRQITDYETSEDKAVLFLHEEGGELSRPHTKSTILDGPTGLRNSGRIFLVYAPSRLAAVESVNGANFISTFGQKWKDLPRTNGRSFCMVCSLIGISP